MNGFFISYNYVAINHGPWFKKKVNSTIKFKRDYVIDDWFYSSKVKLRILWFICRYDIADNKLYVLPLDIFLCKFNFGKDGTVKFSAKVIIQRSCKTSTYLPKMSSEWKGEVMDELYDNQNSVFDMRPTSYIHILLNIT